MAQAGYVADVGTDIDAFVARIDALGGPVPSPFQGAGWLRAWYATLGAENGRRPVLVGVRDQATGADVMLLPLVAQMRRGRSVVRFADADVVDYNLPLLANAWAGTTSDAAMRQHANALWRALRTALAGHDLLVIDKMPLRTLSGIDAIVNPLALALRTDACEMQGNELRLTDDWDAWRHSLGKHARKEFERSWRVFTRSAEARFERITDPREALAVFEQLEIQQANRMRETGQRYVLDQPAYRAFYRRAMDDGLADGRVVLTALRDGAHVVAAQFGIADGDRFISLRLSTGGEDWSACSPGRLLLERTAAHLHAQGLRGIDFGIGAYRHKQMFDVTPIALVDAVQALSWRGLPAVWAWRLKRRLKQQRWLVAAVRRWPRAAPQVRRLASSSRPRRANSAPIAAA